LDPAHAPLPLVFGVMVKVTVSGALVAFTNVIAGIVVVLLLLAGLTPVMPAGTEVVQSNKAPPTTELSVTAAEVMPEQIVCGPGLMITSGVGLMVMSTVIVLPGQLTELLV
jgi:hypothetical protein